MEFSDSYNVSKEDQWVKAQNGIVMYIYRSGNDSRYRHIVFYREEDLKKPVSIDSVFSPRRKYRFENRIGFGAVKGSVLPANYVSLYANISEMVDHMAMYAGTGNQESVPEYTHIIMGRYIVRDIGDFNHLVEWLWQEHYSSGTHSMDAIDNIAPECGFPLAVDWTWNEYEDEWEFKQSPITKQDMIQTIWQIRRLI